MAGDIRNERTERAIVDAFLEELSARPLTDITVSSVAKRADISRSTFYAHFSNMREVFDFAVAEFVGNVRELHVQLRCATCGDDARSFAPKVPFCVALRSAGRFESLVRCSEFLPAYLDLVDRESRNAVLGELIDAGIQPDIARNVMRFQLSGCYMVAMSAAADADWSLSQAALDTFIRGGINSLKGASRSPGSRNAGI